MEWTSRIKRGNICKELSKNGRKVRVEVSCRTYAGARPYFTVSYLQKDARGPQSRTYTPIEDRAEYLFRLFLQDVTDPVKL